MHLPSLPLPAYLLIQNTTTGTKNKNVIIMRANVKIQAMPVMALSAKNKPSPC